MGTGGFSDFSPPLLFFPPAFYLSAPRKHDAAELYYDRVLLS